MMKPSVNKAASNRTHARRRASERFGMDIGPRALLDIESRIRSGAGDCVALRPDAHVKARSLYAVKHEDRWLPVMYDGATKSILTVLPVQALDPYLATLNPLAPAAGDEEEKLYTLRKALASPDPEPGETATVGEYEAALLAILEKTNAAREILSCMRARDGRRPGLEAELQRLALRTREWKRRKHETYLRSRILLGTGLIDPDDTTALLRAAHVALDSMARRLNWEITEQEQAVRHAMEAYLELNARG